MSNKVIFTNLFKVYHPHLDAAFTHEPAQAPKYSVAMAFPKTGVLPANIGVGSTDIGLIMSALEEVCQAEWKVSYTDAPQLMGIQFPPTWKDGDTDWQKNDKGMILQGQVKELSAGYWMLNVKNLDPVGTVDAFAQDILPAAVYAGSWAKAQLEVSAYTNGSKQNILSVKLLNIQMCYDDTPIGGNGPVQAASQAFAGMEVAGTNMVQGFGTVAPAVPALPVVAAAPAVPALPAAPSVPVVPALPVVPGEAYLAPVIAAPALPVITPVVAAPTYSVTAAAAGHTVESLLATPGWTTELAIQHGLIVQDVAAPTAPALPVLPTLTGQ